MVHPAFAAHQRARWLRKDAAVWVRPDAVKFLKPGSDPADVYPALAPRRDARLRADARAVDDGIASERAVLDNLRADLAQIKHDLVWQRLESDVSQTGRLPGQTIVRLSPEGVPISHSWNEAH